jgi:hypothetical protein
MEDLNVSDQYESLMNDMDKLVHEMLTTHLKFEKAASLSTSEVQKMEELAKEKLAEYNTQAFSWPEEFRASFEANMNALSLQIQQKTMDSQQYFKEIDILFQRFSAQVDHFSYSLTKLIENVTRKVKVSLLLESEDPLAGVVRRRISAPKSYAELLSQVRSKFNIEHDFHVVRINGHIKNLIGSQLELLETYEEVLANANSSAADDKQQRIECKFCVVFSSRKREKSQSPDTKEANKKMKYSTWTTEDIVKLRTAIFRLGFGSWIKIQEDYFPKRSVDSIRSFAEKHLKDEESACDKELLDRRLFVKIAADTATVSRIALECAEKGQVDQGEEEPQD